MPRSRIPILVLALVAALAVPAGADAAKPKREYYVSLGDSYAIGFQPSVVRKATGTRNGFAYQLPGLAKRRGYRFKLVNFGCGGETSVSILERKAKCGGLGPGGVDYAGTTQATGSASFTHAVTSLPPIETVTSFTWPRCLRRKRSAAVAWVTPA